MESENLEKKWIVNEQGNPALVRQLSSALGVDQVLCNLLVQRGITSFEESRRFFRPSLDMLYDPFLMKDMGKAVERLHKAIVDNERILIYGDYDVDGTTAVALVYSFISQFNKNIDYYIPDRYDEGSGVSYKGIDWAHDNGFQLVISLDCGIKAIEKVKYAKQFGIDFIICDHHLPDEELPQSVATLDPKRTDCNYPFDDLSGCGVGFKLVQGYAQKYCVPFERITPLLDLVAVSIAADLVSVVDENRVLAYYGLRQLNENPRKGLLSMIKLCGLDKHEASGKRNNITLDDVVFKIGPRINAAGRMESGRIAVDLLTAGNDKEAEKIGETINIQNKERKRIDREITIEAIKMVKNSHDSEEKSATVVYNPSWHKGVVAIVASRLVEVFYKPTIVLTKSNGFITGSARSVNNFDLYAAIENCADLLENFGGHTYAAGLTMKEENLPEFSQRFEAYVKENITKEVMTPLIHIDSFLDFKQITPRFFRILKQFQPFGPGNTSPVFLTENVYDNGNGRKVGTDNGHLKLELIQEDEPYRHISAIAFNKSEYFEHIQNGNPIDICYSIAENYYRGLANIQLRIKDIKNREDFI